MLRQNCLTKACTSCEFHGSCLMEREMKNTIIRLGVRNTVKYDLAVIIQKDKKCQDKK